MLEDGGEKLQALINVNPSQGLKHGGTGELYNEKSLSALALLLVSFQAPQLACQYLAPNYPSNSKFH